ncbi:reverse transcriptase domain-containing protein [Tanacetum coccineum]
MGTFLLNNRYAFMLFDSGADRSFVLTDFCSLINIAPTTLDYSYAVELADGRIAESSTILRGCILNLLDHPFNIYLIPVELGSFDVIIGMDWLSKYHAVIVCDEKVVRNPLRHRFQTPWSVFQDGSRIGVPQGPVPGSQAWARSHIGPPGGARPCLSQEAKCDGIVLRNGQVSTQDRPEICYQPTQSSKRRHAKDAFSTHYGAT